MTPLDRWTQLRTATERDPEEVAALVTLHARAQIQAGALMEALQTLSEAAGWGVVHPNMFLLQGLALEALAARLPEVPRAHALEQAVQALRLAPQWQGRPLPPGAPLLPGATSWAAQARLGACLLALGRPEEARDPLLAAHAAQPDLEDVRLNLAEVLLETDPDQSLHLIGDLAAAAAGGGADAGLLAAAAHEVRGDLPAMGTALLSATQAATQGFQAPRRQALMNELVALLGILQGEPRPGWGAMGALSGLMSGYPPSSAEVHPAPPGSATHRRLAHVLAFLRERGEATLLAALREPPVRRLFPGIEALLS